MKVRLILAAALVAGGLALTATAGAQDDCVQADSVHDLAPGETPCDPLPPEQPTTTTTTPTVQCQPADSEDDLDPGVPACEPCDSTADAPPLLCDEDTPDHVTPGPGPTPDCLPADGPDDLPDGVPACDPVEPTVAVLAAPAEPTVDLTWVATALAQIVSSV